MTDDSVGFWPPRWCPFGWAPAWLASLFYRVDEIHNLSFKASLFALTVSVFFPKRKKDQYREGQMSLLAMSQKSVCHVSITKRLLQLFPPSRESSSPLVRQIVKSKSKEYFHATKGVSYTTLKEEFRTEGRKPFVDSIANYGMHSVKSGADSNPA